MQYTVKHLDAKAAAAMRDSVVEVYRSVYSLPPYNESENQITAFSNSWETRTSKAGFLFVGAFDKQEKLVGLSYGWRSVVGDAWNSLLAKQLGNSSEKWLSDCFEFVDLAVKPETQGAGLGRELTQNLFALTKAKTAILLTHQSTTRASEMYVRNGWERLVQNFEIAPGKVYQIMGKSL